MKLGIDLSLGTDDKAQPLAWQPSDEGTCVGWYKYATGFTTVSGAVSEWADQSGNGNDATQTDAANRPALDGSTVVFDGDTAGDPDHLDIPQISMTGDFTIGVSMHLDAVGGTLLGDNQGSTTNEFIRFTQTRVVGIKNEANAKQDLDLSTDYAFTDSGYLVISRSTVGGVADTLQMWWNGELQTSTAVLDDTCLYDAIGVRKSDNNALDGNIYELQIFSSANDALTTNINTRLGTIPRK